MSASDSPESAEAYTVAWITALYHERAAGESMFDAEYDEPECFEQNERDINAYSWGRMGNHNVVIASLPEAEYGTAVFTPTPLMRWYFVQTGGGQDGRLEPNPTKPIADIRIGLLVGIGAGIPGEQYGHDNKLELRPPIQLGDVAVSQPGNGTGGVIQFDRVAIKESDGKVSVENRGWLDSSPQAVRTALSALRARHDLKGNLISDIIQKAYQRYPNMKGTYSHPGLRMPEETRRPDIYYTRSRTGITHEASHTPNIHYGVIASSNSLVKSALERDAVMERLKTRGINPICIEMEAAGLMNSFPCLVIRGICDYADEHKNDDWQKYAAMAAAAYAKDYLQSVSAKLVKQGRTIEQLLTKIAPALEQVGKIARSTREKEIKDWLAPADASTNHNQARKQHHTGTGQWLLEAEQYKRWKTQNECSALWLHGGSGCGKTILSSSIIADVEADSRLVVYFYFDINDTSKQSFEQMLRSLIFQLYLEVEQCRTHLEKLRDKHKQPQHNILLSVWETMTAGLVNVCVVIDALDECNDWKDLLRWLPSIKCGSVRLLLTSQPAQEIEVSVREWISKDNVVSISRNPVDDDIRMVIRSRVAEDTGLQYRWRKHPGVLAAIESKLMAKADGMFRLVVCQLDVLQDSLDPRDLDKALRDLPDTLAGIYTRILRNIPERYRESAIRLLQFLLYANFAEEPFRLECAIDAIAVRPNETPAFSPDYRMADCQEVARYCSSLTKVTTERRPKHRGFLFNPQFVCIRLAHASVNEYLVSELVPGNFRSGLERKLAHEAIVSVCVAYLITGAELSASFCSGTHPFVHYCAHHWLSHAHEVEERNLESSAWAVALLTSEKARAYWLLSGKYGLKKLYQTPVGNPVPPPLYFASLGGLTETARVLLEQGANGNAPGGSCGNALNAAAAEGHTRMVQLLLDNNADVNWKGEQKSESSRDYPNALYVAAKGGHEEVVRILIERQPNVNALGGAYGSALNAACGRGHAGVVRLLLEAGADINGGHRSALTDACEKGHEVVVRMLIDSGADVNANDGSALQESSRYGKLAVIQMLLEHGAMVNVQGGRYCNALVAACATVLRADHTHQHDHQVLPVVRLLLKNGAEVHHARQHDEFPNALYVAARNGLEAVVQLLLQHGTNANTQGGYLFSALNAALESGHKSIAQLLLAEGADVYMQGGSHGNTLTAAAYGGCEAVVRLLLEGGADVNARGGKYGTPLQAACSHIYDGEALKAMAHLLLESGAEINARAGEERLSALQGAVKRSATSVVEMLIESGADINAPGGRIGNALQIAASQGDKYMIRLLLNRGADINAPGDHLGSTALMMAAKRHDASMVRLLLEEGADPNLQGGQYGNALKTAHQYTPRSYPAESREITQMLLAAGAVDYGPEGNWVDVESQMSTTEFQSSRSRQVLERLRTSGLMGRQCRWRGRKYAVVFRWRGTVGREW
ncbi:hypothetical protein LTR15_010268 [Elasticomyces elasticus]|nr:hypothetical protein LTR15_010268 [Elasticomyces elasticus]